MHASDYMGGDLNYNVSHFFQCHDDISYGCQTRSPTKSMADQIDGRHRTDDESEKLRHELEMTRKEWLSEQQRVSELEEQLISISESLSNRF